MIVDEYRDYIKMCDCPEIQEYWIRTPWGTLTAPRYGLYVYVKLCDEILVLQCSFESDVGIFLYFGQALRNFKTSECLWIPRQDDLQRMIPDFNIYIAPARFSDWVANHALRQGDVFWSSMEELWLAFVMWELHKKRWDGEKWK